MRGKLRRGAGRWASAAILCAALSGVAGLRPVLSAEGEASHVSQVVDVDVVARWQAPQKPFEGWGTALVWFAHITGQLPLAQREHLADLLYGRDGLRLNIARYNIGGGNAEDAGGYLRPGADIPGFWRKPAGADLQGADWWRADDPAMWDWTADQGQRWWLDAIRRRVPADEQIFEAFSNSPPYFMTVSGKVSGHENGLENNLRPGEEARFADYLVTVTLELERRHHIHFRTLSPVNEPNTPYWFAANTQEGAHWSPDAQSRILKAVQASLRTHGARTEISAVDETNAQTFVLDWAGLDDGAKAAIGQVNVHSYDTTGKTAARDIGRITGKRLWMSEVDLSPPNVPQDFDDMRPAIALGEQIVSDINRIQPVAWVLWQAIENETKAPGKGSNWGLIKMDYANTHDPEIHVTTKYFAMASFSRYIRPGDRFVPVDDSDTVIALKPDGKSFVVVHVNPGLYARHLRLAAPDPHQPYTVMRIVTDPSHRAAFMNEASGLDGLTAPPQSITTFVVTVH